MKKVLITAICVILAAALCVGGYSARAYYIKNFGLKLTPAEDFPITVNEYYIQNDPLWSNEKIGKTNTSLGGSGCLIASVATAIKNLGIPVTPAGLNQKLTEKDGFSGADLIWYKINEALPGVNYRYSRIFTRGLIENDLKNGLLPVVCVKYHKTGISHWVLIAGSKNGEFYVLDPLDNSGPIPLSSHGNVYAYRVIVKNGGN
jgi:hypothetical protein